VPSTRRFTQWPRTDRIVKLRALPLRSEQSLLGGAMIGRADHVAGRAQEPHAIELTSTTLTPAAVLSNRISSGAATMARPRSVCVNKFCVVTTRARFSMARAQMSVRQVAHSVPLSLPPA